MVGAIIYLATSILPLREFMPHDGLFVMIRGGALSYLTTSILPILEIVHHYDIFVMIGVGRIEISDQFYSAPSRNYAPL